VSTAESSLAATWSACTVEPDPTCQNTLVTRTKGFWHNKNGECYLQGSAHVVLLPVTIGAGCDGEMTFGVGDIDALQDFLTANQGVTDRAQLKQQLLATIFNIRTWQIGALEFENVDADDALETIAEIADLGEYYFCHGSDEDATRIAGVLDRINNAGDSASNEAVVCDAYPDICGQEETGRSTDTESCLCPVVDICDDPLACDDQNACTMDVCNSVTGCSHEVIDCNDGNGCTQDSCDPATGCVNTALACDDSNACTTDSCSEGSDCTHEAVNCDDGDACTVDSCDAVEGCKHEQMSCDDGNLCTTDSCEPLEGCKHEAAVCNDDNACTLDTCNPLTGECVFESNGGQLTVGPAYGYNAFLFEGYTGGLDVEGSLAVGGNLSMLGFSIGLKYEGSGPTVVVGGDVTLSSGEIHGDLV